MPCSSSQAPSHPSHLPLPLLMVNACLPVSLLAPVPIALSLSRQITLIPGNCPIYRGSAWALVLPLGPQSHCRQLPQQRPSAQLNSAPYPPLDIRQEPLQALWTPSLSCLWISYTPSCELGTHPQNTLWDLSHPGILGNTSLKRASLLAPWFIFF